MKSSGDGMLGIGAHRTACALLPVLVAPLLIITTAAKAERIENDVAVFAALDKVTARVHAMAARDPILASYLGAEEEEHARVEA